MSLSKEVLEALEARLKTLVETAEPDQLAYLAKALESVAGKTTAFDLMQSTFTVTTNNHTSATIKSAAEPAIQNQSGCPN